MLLACALKIMEYDKKQYSPLLIWIMAQLKQAPDAKQHAKINTDPKSEEKLVPRNAILKLNTFEWKLCMVMICSLVLRPQFYHIIPIN